MNLGWGITEKSATAQSLCFENVQTAETSAIFATNDTDTTKNRSLTLGSFLYAAMAGVQGWPECRDRPERRDGSTGTQGST
jgi:hypothetical protein